MTWTEVVELLRAELGIAVEHGRWCGLVLALDGEAQRVMATRAADGASIIVSAPVASLRHIDPLEALQYNRVAEQWSLGLDGDVYVLEQSLALCSLDERALVGCVHAAARHALRLRRARVPKPVPFCTLVGNLGFWFEN